MINSLNSRIEIALQQLRLILPDREVKAIGSLFKEQKTLIDDVFLVVNAAIQKIDDGQPNKAMSGLINLSDRIKESKI